jgi:D-proline reductase (dithiol) PrdB
MPALTNLPQTLRTTLLTLPVAVNESAPFTVPAKPLAQSRLALVTTAGLHVRGDRPFVSGDATFRRIPSSIAGGELVQSHSSIGFDRTGFIADVNVVFPLDRLREMVAAKRIGELAPTFFSFMGAQRDTTTIMNEGAPQVAAALREEHVDVVLLTPS